MTLEEAIAEVKRTIVMDEPWSAEAVVLQAVASGDLIPRADAEAEVARLKEWADVVSWIDSGEKTLFDWYTGGGDTNGEFHRVGLRREMPDGTVLYRAYTADGPWQPAAIKGDTP